MWNQSYLDHLQTLFKWDFKLLCPWRDELNKSKLTKLFRAYSLSPLGMMLMEASLVYFEWDTLPYTTIVENMAMSIVMFRSYGYVILLKQFFSDYKNQIDKLIQERRSLPSDLKDKLITDAYCRTEFISTVAWKLSCYCIVFLLFHVYVYFLPNAYHLPLNCYIFFLPPDGFLFAWELNYVAITAAIVFIGCFGISYFPFLHILMNNSCWFIDMALVTADNMNTDLQLDENIRDPERVSRTDKSLTKFAERCEKFVEWQSATQNLLFWYFNLEFHVQSLFLCLLIYVLSFTFASGVIWTVFTFSAAQMFMLCWMGERVRSRIERLSYEISKNWYLMTLPQRKVAQMILHWTQNMKGFSGLFKDVSLETCKAIFEASYTFYAFLHSTNGN